MTITRYSTAKASGSTIKIFNHDSDNLKWQIKNLVGYVAVPREKCYAAKSQQPLLHNSLGEGEGDSILYALERDERTVTEIV